MLISNGATIAVCDGETLNLYRNTGDLTDLELAEIPVPELESDNKSSGIRHHSSAANPDRPQLEEDSFAAGAAELLNRMVLDGQISELVVVAAPRTLGELRKHYHQKLDPVLKAEIAKELTGHSVDDLRQALFSA